MLDSDTTQEPLVGLVAVEENDSTHVIPLFQGTS